MSEGKTAAVIPPDGCARAVAGKSKKPIKNTIPAAFIALNISALSARIRMPVEDQFPDLRIRIVADDVMAPIFA
jgi:hypothetical protein